MDVFCFQFQLQSPFPPAEQSSGNHHFPSTLQIFQCSSFHLQKDFQVGRSGSRVNAGHPGLGKHTNWPHVIEPPIKTYKNPLRRCQTMALPKPDCQVFGMLRWDGKHGAMDWRQWLAWKSMDLIRAAFELITSCTNDQSNRTVLVVCALRYAK